MVIKSDKETEITKLNLLMKEASKKAIELKKQAMATHFEKINQIVAVSYANSQLNVSK